MCYVFNFFRLDCLGSVSESELSEAEFELNLLEADLVLVELSTESRDTACAAKVPVAFAFSSARTENLIQLF